MPSTLSPSSKEKPSAGLSFYKMIYSDRKIALMNEGQVQEFIFLYPENVLIPNTICLGKVKTKVHKTHNQEKGKNDYFILLPKGHEGLLSTANKLVEGEMVVVRISKTTRPFKQIKLSTDVGLTSCRQKEIILSSPPIPAEIHRPDELEEILHSCHIGEVISDDMGFLQTIEKLYQNKDSDHETDDLSPAMPHLTSLPFTKNAFTEYGLDEILSDCMDCVFITPEGIRLFFEYTQAFWAIDVDSGSCDIGDFTSINMLASKYITKQIRLRNIAGQIVVDFISSRQNRLSKKVVEATKTYLQKDRTDAFVAGVSPLGHLEIVRKYERPPLMFMPHLGR